MRSRLFVAIGCLVVAIGMTPVTKLQGSDAPRVSGKQSVSSAENESNEAVEYRLVKWKTAHAPNVEAGKKMAETLKKLKCEVRTSSHGNHIDVTYRCAGWKKLALKDHATAHKWESWLKKYGFETKHIH